MTILATRTGTHTDQYVRNAAFAAFLNWLGSRYLKGSPERGKVLLRGQQALFEQVRKAGKYVIFNGLRPTQDYVALDTLLPHADSGYFEPWLGGSFRNSAGKLNASKVQLE